MRCNDSLRIFSLFFCFLWQSLWLFSSSARAGIDQTTRDAATAYDVFVAHDACAARTVDAHEFTLRTLRGYATLVTSDELRRQLATQQPAAV